MFFFSLNKNFLFSKTDKNDCLCWCKVKFSILQVVRRLKNNVFKPHSIYTLCTKEKKRIVYALHNDYWVWYLESLKVRCRGWAPWKHAYFVVLKLRFSACFFFLISLRMKTICNAYEIKKPKLEMLESRIVFIFFHHCFNESKI